MYRGVRLRGIALFRRMPSRRPPKTDLQRVLRHALFATHAALVVFLDFRQNISTEIF